MYMYSILEADVLMCICLYKQVLALTGTVFILLNPKQNM